MAYAYNPNNLEAETGGRHVGDKPLQLSEALSNSLTTHKTLSQNKK